jgi:tetratricopeptide (TPR) repeat protein
MRTGNAAHDAQDANTARDAHIAYDAAHDANTARQGVFSRRPSRLLIPALAGAPLVVLCWTGATLAMPLPASLNSALPASLDSALSLLHPHLPAWAERWLYNPRERTAAAIDSLARHDGKAAVAAADTAHRLAAGDPLASYNAGSARLAAGTGDSGGSPGSRDARAAPRPGNGRTAPRPGDERALAQAAEPLLEEAVRGAGADLAVAASYNLGNARLAAGDYAGAIEAYKQTLRAAPSAGDAKFNLELALRAQQRQPPNPPRGVGPRGGGGRPRPGERGQTAGEGGSGGGGANQQPGRQPDQHAPAPAQDRSQGQSGQAQTAQGLHGQPSPLAGRQPLAGYQDQPEMSASEAAAVLEAVQNLERQQRRQAAARLARQRAANGEDW